MSIEFDFLFTAFTPYFRGGVMYLLRWTPVKLIMKMRNLHFEYRHYFDSDPYTQFCSHTDSETSYIIRHKKEESRLVV